MAKKDDSFLDDLDDDFGSDGDIQVDLLALTGRSNPRRSIEQLMEERRLNAMVEDIFETASFGESQVW